MMLDILNGIFESAGGLFIMASVLRLFRDKKTRGVSAVYVVFFTAWGFWNLVYYPSLGQWWSFAGGIGVVLANMTWLGLMFHYRRN